MVRRRVAVVLLGGLLAAVAMGCAKEIEKPNGYAETPGAKAPNPTGNTEGGFPDSGTKTDSGVDAGDGGDGGVCTDIALTGVLVDRTGITADPPVSSGGVVVDGTYDMTGWVVYVGAVGVGGPTGLSGRATLRIAAGKIDQIFETSGSAPAKTITSKSAYSATGSVFATTDLCPLGGGAQRQYTANGPQLLLTDPVTKEAFTFVKR
jgi:hypothetical protein